MSALRPLFAVVAVAGLLVLRGVALDAQDLTIEGRVVSAADSSALGGVAIHVEGTQIGVLTNRDGTYTFNSRNASDTLVFTALGYQTQTVPVDGRTVVDVSLAPTPRASLDRMIVRGYVGGPQTSGATAVCYRTIAPMPGSAYDLNWQGENPELARLLLPDCLGQRVGYRSVPPTSLTPPATPAPPPASPAD